VNSAHPLRRETAGDRAGLESEIDQLRASHDPVLASRELADRPFAGSPGPNCTTPFAIPAARVALIIHINVNPTRAVPAPRSVWCCAARAEPRLMPLFA
jgi:hypothetical protein